MDGDAQLGSRERQEGAAAPVGGGVDLPGAVGAEQDVPGFSSGLREAAKDEAVIQMPVDAATEKQNHFKIGGATRGPRELVPSVSSVLGLSDVKWQWEHRSGWRYYALEESARIEDHFQAGDWMMRFKSGKGKHTKPREIYYYNMVQLDPSSGNFRKINRSPPANCYHRCARRYQSMKQGLLRGERRWWGSKSREWFEEERKDRDHMTMEQRHGEMYKVRRIWYRITRMPSFQSWCVLCILANAIWLFFEADNNTGTTVLDTDWGWIIGENIFCVWFSTELIIRSLAFKSCRYLCQDGWFMLDFVLVVLMAFETWALQLGVYISAGRSRSSHSVNKFAFLRSFRLLRLARITRLFKVFPELFALLKGVVVAMRSLVYTLIMLFVVTFITGVVYANFARQNEELKAAGFSTVAASMWTLMLNGIFMDSLTDKMNAIKNVHLGYAYLFLFFIFMSNMTLLNLLIGILADVVTRVSSSEMDNTIRKNLELTITEILECYDVDDNGRIKRAEFQQLTNNDELANILRRHQIEIDDLKKLEDVLFENKGDQLGEGEPSFGFAEFLDKVFQLRGGNSATVNDIAELRAFINKRVKKVEDKLHIAPALFSSLSSPEIVALQSEPGDSPERRLREEEVMRARSEIPMVSKPFLLAEPPAVPETAAVPATSSDFQAQVLAQLTAIREDQQVLRGEVKNLNERVRMLQEGFMTAAGGIVMATGEESGEAAGAVDYGWA